MNGYTFLITILLVLLLALFAFVAGFALGTELPSISYLFVVSRQPKEMRKKK